MYLLEQRKEKEKGRVKSIFCSHSGGGGGGGKKIGK